MSLSTIYLYKNQFPTSTDTDSTIQLSLNTATSYIESYLDRNLQNQEYIEIVEVEDNLVQLEEYPITKIKNILTEYNDTILLQTDDTLYQVQFDGNATSITITTTDNSANESETIINYSTAANLYSLTTLIDNISGLTATINNNYYNIPSKLLMPINKIMSTNTQVSLHSWYRNNTEINYKIQPETNRNLLVSKSKGYIYVDYYAGYTYPIDDGTHTSLATTGDVPAILTDICNKLAYIVIGDMVEVKSGYYKSENLGDYSYTLSDSARSSVESMLNSYDYDLNQFKKTWLVG